MGNFGVMVITTSRPTGNRPHSDRAAAAALIGGVAAGLLTMMLHPTGSEVVQAASQGENNTLVTAVHALAIAGQGAQLAGAVALVRRLVHRRDLGVGGYVFFALAAICALIAATASGFVAPGSVSGYGEANEATRQAMLQSLHYTAIINRSFSQLFVLASSVAILLWSLAMIIGRDVSRALGWFGVILSVALIATAGSGHVSLDIHGFGSVVLLEGIWLSWAGVRLWGSQPPTRVSDTGSGAA